MYKNIIWDIDGTLFDTYPSIASAFQAALEDCGVSADIGYITGLAVKSLGYCVETLAEKYHLPEDRINELFGLHYDLIGYINQPPFPYATDVCRLVASLGGRNVIVTHRGAQGTKGLLMAHGMIDLFEGWITRDDGYPRKPDPAAFVASLGRFDLQKKETMAIGDRAIDIIAAQAAGIFACCYGTAGDNAQPDLCLQDYRVLHKFLANDP